jgi:FkbM family methyltransferase
MKYLTALEALGFSALQPGHSDREAMFWSAEWEARFDNFSSAFSAFSATPGSRLKLPNINGPVALEMLCTAWSGQLELTANGQSVVVDTYAPEHQLRIIPLPGSGLRDVEVCVLADRHPNSSDSQIWMHAILFEVRPDWLPRALQVTPSLSFVDGKYGNFLVLDKDRPVSYDIKRFGVWGEYQVDQFRTYVKPGTLVADVGANIGHHSVMLAKMVGPTGRVLAFEPQVRVHNIMRANLALNQCDNVEAYECALGAEAADAQMQPQDYDGQEWNVGGLAVAVRDGELEFRPDGLPIKIRKLDDIVGDRDLDFVKSDAQGFDFEVMKGAVNTLRRCRPMLVCEVAPSAIKAAGSDYREFYAFLHDLGYDLYDPDAPSSGQEPRIWSGRDDEEWDILAIHRDRDDHKERMLKKQPPAP